MRQELPLPAGPRAPAAWLALATWKRPAGSLRRVGRRYGKRVTVKLPFRGAFVLLSDPDEIKELFMAPPDVLHPGEGARVLEPVLGRHSVILLDEDPHLEQRKLMLPAFHGKRVEQMSDVVTELAEREVASWPREEPVALHSLLQRLTFEMILRVVFGLEQGERLNRLRDALTEVLAWAESPLSYVVSVDRKKLDWLGPVKRLNRVLERTDAMIFNLIEERRAGTAAYAADHGNDDVLSVLLEARHEDETAAGAPMSPQEIRDELVTALVAGHETTASQLAWAFERLVRNPAVLTRLTAEIDAGESDEYLTATIHEILRLKPVLPNCEPRLVKRPVTIGGFTYPAGVSLVASAYLVHHDPEIYPDPYAFRPERFLERQPGTYTWIPFGGGRRRCLGASFAMLEMKIVLRTVLESYEILPAASRPEGTRRRSITFSPARGAEVVLRSRARTAAPLSSPALAAAD